MTAHRPIACVLAAAASIAALALAPGCDDRVDGLRSDAGMGTACTRDRECGAGRHCSMGVCSIDCVTSNDCAPAASGDARECSACGRCVAPGQIDALCTPERDVACTSTAQCQEGLGEAYECNERHVCARRCADDDTCSEIGRGWVCMAGNCRRGCIDEDQCALHGFAYTCLLPDGADAATNHDAPEPAVGECIPREGGIDWGPGGAVSAPGQSYRGIWGVLLNTAAHVTDVPVVGEQNTMQTAYLLVKMTEEGGVVTWHEKWCSIAFQNFNDDDTQPHVLFTPVASDRYTDAIRIQQNHVATPPAFTPGASFATDTMLEVRGAKVPDPATSPLPTSKDLTFQFDQDHDGKPGMTLQVTGIATGEIDHAQRWTLSYAATVVDRDHLQGLVTSVSEQRILAASEPALLYDTTSGPHPDPSRTYFRAVRVPDDASCEDVAALAGQKDGWLAFEPHFDPAKKPR